MNTIVFDPFEQDKLEANRKLHHLGYTFEFFKENLAVFQHDFRHRGLQETGELDDQTRSVLNEVHNNCQDDLHSV